jgi:hypothetical protein
MRGDVGVQAGFGRLVGAEIDKNRGGPAFSIVAGFRPHDRIAVRAELDYHYVVLRQAQAIDRADGHAVAALVGLHVHLTKPSRIAKVHLGPFVGFQLVRTRAQYEGAVVRGELRGPLVGIEGGLLFGPKLGAWAIGPKLSYGLLIPTHACVELDRDTVACRSGRPTVEGYLFAAIAFRWQFRGRSRFRGQ